MKDRCERIRTLGTGQDHLRRSRRLPGRGSRRTAARDVRRRRGPAGECRITTGGGCRKRGEPRAVCRWWNARARLRRGRPGSRRSRPAASLPGIVWETTRYAAFSAPVGWGARTGLATSRLAATLGSRFCPARGWPTLRVVPASSARPACWPRSITPTSGRSTASRTTAAQPRLRPSRHSCSS